jgi:replicative DNA helicase
VITAVTSHDVNAEREVIGALLRSARRVLELVAVEPREFFLPAHQLIAQATLDLVAQGKPVDPILVADHLGDRVASVGGLAELADLASGYLTAENVAHWVAIVRDHALKRRVAVACGEVMAVANNAHDSGEDAHSALIRAASSVERADQGDRASTLAEVVDESADRLIAAAKGEVVHVRSVLTGYEDLDDLGGIARGVVTIIAGRPSQGKSALARRIALNVVKAGEGAHVISLEDAKDRYGDRMLSDIADVDLAKFSERRPVLTRDDGERIRWAREHVKNLPLLVDDAAGLSAQQIANRVRMRKRQLGTKLVVVDYVQLMQEKGSRDKRAEVDAAVEGLVRLARDEDVALLLLSQLSRESERRDDKRPLLSDLRESGSLEQAAYAVWMVHQEWLYLNPESKSAEVRAAYEKAFNMGEVLVRKNKNGRKGDVRLRWNAPTATYQSLSLKERYMR